MGSGKAIVGGLLSGLGDGMIQQAEAKRLRAMEILEAERKAREKREDRDFQLQRDETNFERQRGLLHGTRTDEQGNIHGVTRGGEVRDLNLKTSPPGKKGSDGDGDGDGAGIGLSAAEERTFDHVIAVHTDPNTKRTDWRAVIGQLRGMPDERGGDRWNEIADYLTGDVGARMTESAAREQAEQEARSRHSVWSSRESEFSETGGDRDAWIKQRAAEIRGGGASGGSSKDEPAQDAGAVSGSGTQVDPYRPTTQAQFDQLPSGAIFRNPADGQLYRKN